MGKSKLHRTLFFWLDRQQISKDERIALLVVMVVVVITVGMNVLLNKSTVPAPGNHQAILEEFERKSALIKEKEGEMQAKYSGIQEVELKGSEVMNTNDKKAASSQKINLNTATRSELESLPGIGSTYAQRIIDYRETNGGFSSVEELVEVKGIGDKTLEELKPFIEL